MKRPIANRQLTIGNDLAVAEGFEPSHGRINNPVPYRLGYATRELAAATRVELAHPRLQDERSVCPFELRRNLVDWEGFKPSQEVCRTSMLSLHHQPGAFIICHWTFFICSFIRVLSGLIEPDDRRERLKITKWQISNDKWKMIWWLWVESNHQPRAYETLALFRLSYTAVVGFGSPRRS
jgi:hypothetical protein